MSKTELPLYSVDLIKQLDKDIPHETPSLSEPERAIFYRAGQRDLVDRLLILSQQSVEEDYDPEKSLL